MTFFAAVFLTMALQYPERWGSNQIRAYNYDQALQSLAEALKVLDLDLGEGPSG